MSSSVIVAKGARFLQKVRDHVGRDEPGRADTRILPLLGRQIYLGRLPQPRVLERRDDLADGIVGVLDGRLEDRRGSFFPIGKSIDASRVEYLSGGNRLEVHREQVGNLGSGNIRRTVRGLAGDLVEQRLHLQVVVLLGQEYVVGRALEIRVVRPLWIGAGIDQRVAAEIGEGIGRLQGVGIDCLAGRVVKKRRGRVDLRRVEIIDGVGIVSVSDLMRRVLFDQSRV